MIINVEYYVTLSYGYIGTTDGIFFYSKLIICSNFSPDIGIFRSLSLFKKKEQFVDVLQRCFLTLMPLIWPTQYALMYV